MMSKETACLETPRTLPLSCNGFPAWPVHGLERGCWWVFPRVVGQAAPAPGKQASLVRLQACTWVEVNM